MNFADNSYFLFSLHMQPINSNIQKVQPFLLAFFLLLCFCFCFSLVQFKKIFFFTLDSVQVFLPLFSFFFLLLNLENFSDSFLNSVLLPGQLLLFLKVSNSSSFFSSLCTFQFLLLSLVFLSESTIFNHTDHPDSLHEDLQFALIYMLVFYTLHIYFTIPWDATRRSLFLG